MLGWLKRKRPWRVDRDPKTALAHTREEGGSFWRGGAAPGEFHSVFFKDGWVYDIRLAELGINGGWRRSSWPIEDIWQVGRDPALFPNTYLAERARENENHAARSRRQEAKQGGISS